MSKSFLAISVVGALLTGCADPWEKDIPRLQETYKERSEALITLRASDIQRFKAAGYSESISCPTIFIKQGALNSTGNPHEVVKIHSVVLSNPEHGDHFYSFPTQKKVARILETTDGVNYGYHPIGWTLSIDTDTINEGTLECEPQETITGYFRQSFGAHYTTGTKELR